MPIRPPIQMWKDIRELSSWCRATTATPDTNSISTDMLQDAAVTNAKLRDSTGRSVIGRSAATVGAPADIIATADDQVLQRLSGVLSWAAMSASRVTFAPTGGISATFVDTALAELDTEKLAASSYTAADVLTKLLTVDGAGSGLDADLLDGQSSAYYRDASNINAGTLDDARIPSTIARDAEVTAAIAALNLASGTYTPTRSAEANLDSNVSMSEAQYLRIGSTVTVSGRFTADPTLAATTTSFEGTLPISSNIGAVEDVAGVAFCGNIAAQGAEVIGVAANDTFKVQWKSGDVTSQTWSYTFTYQII